MSQMQLQTSTDVMQKITRNLAYMRKEKNCLEVRQLAIKRTMKRIECEVALIDDIDEAEEMQDVVDNLSSLDSDLENYRENLEIELSKVDNGVKALSLLKGKPGRRAFAAYVIEDTNLSVRNLTKVRTYYDQVIETLKTLKDA